MRFRNAPCEKGFAALLATPLAWRQGWAPTGGGVSIAGKPPFANHTSTTSLRRV